MNKQTGFILIEIIWWVITGIIIFGSLWPIWSSGVIWYFQWEHIVFCIILITFTRYIFQLSYTWLNHLQWVKAGIMISMIPLTFALISYFNGFLSFIEDHTWEPMTGHLAVASRRGIESYIWRLMLFLGAGCVIAAPAFAVRLFISIWRQHNKQPNHLR
jgi:hypothetical protein